MFWCMVSKRMKEETHVDRYKLLNLNLKPKDKFYKVNDRDVLYVAITPSGSITFRYDYVIYRRQETIAFGCYGVGDIMLAQARERLHEAKKMIARASLRA